MAEIGTSRTKKKKKAGSKVHAPASVTQKAPDIWFDKVDELLLDPVDIAALKVGEVKVDGLVKEKGFKG